MPEVLQLRLTQNLTLLTEPAKEQTGPRLAVERTGTLKEFFSSLKVLVRGPAAPRKFLGGHTFGIAGSSRGFPSTHLQPPQFCRSSWFSFLPRSGIFNRQKRFPRRPARNSPGMVRRRIFLRSFPPFIRPDPPPGRKRQRPRRVEPPTHSIRGRRFFPSPCIRLIPGKRSCSQERHWNRPKFCRRFPTLCSSRIHNRYARNCS